MSFIYGRRAVVNQFELGATGPRLTNKITHGNRAKNEAWGRKR